MSERAADALSDHALGGSKLPGDINVFAAVNHPRGQRFVLVHWKRFTQFFKQISVGGCLVDGLKILVGELYRLHFQSSPCAVINATATQRIDQLVPRGREEPVNRHGGQLALVVMNNHQRLGERLTRQVHRQLPARHTYPQICKNGPLPQPKKGRECLWISVTGLPHEIPISNMLISAHCY